jgi:hypothetical protein
MLSPAIALLGRPNETAPAHWGLPGVAGAVRVYRRRGTSALSDVSSNLSTAIHESVS